MATDHTKQSLSRQSSPGGPAALSNQAQRRRRVNVNNDLDAELLFQATESCNAFMSPEETTSGRKTRWAAAAGSVLLGLAVMTMFVSSSSFFEYNYPLTSLYSTRHTRSRRLDNHDPTNHQLAEISSSLPQEASLDFVIAGFEKCGTSYLKRHLSKHAETNVLRKEFCDIGHGNNDVKVQSKLETELNELLPATQHGFKCPSLVRSEKALRRLQEWHPHAKIIIGLRHPVHWMQSFYNYRVLEVHLGRRPDERVPPLESLATQEWLGVSVQGAKFEYALNMWGKTPGGLGHLVFPTTPFSIFLYDLDQLSDANETRRNDFALGISDFLGLQAPLRVRPDPEKPKDNLTESVDICDKKYKPVRDLLVQHGDRTRKWIQEEFIRSPDVTIVNEDHFRETLNQWSRDPCLEEEETPAALPQEPSVPTNDDPLPESLLPQPPSLDFVIGGFEKCGTTYLKDRLKSHNETDMISFEYCDIERPSLDDIYLFEDLENELDKLRLGGARYHGFTCPGLVRSVNALRRLEAWYPQTKIIVAVRHPIQWLQSFYNYRVHQVHRGKHKEHTEPIPPLETLIGDNDWIDVSTDTVRFEYYLQKLGKTNHTFDDKVFSPTPFPVLIYSLDQFSDKNATRKEDFIQGLSDFLGLQTTLPVTPHHGNTLFNYTESIDICQDEYASLRALLVKQAKMTRQWIQDDFIRSPDVTVVNQEYFLETLDRWSKDPCQDL